MKVESEVQSSIKTLSREEYVRTVLEPSRRSGSSLDNAGVWIPDRNVSIVKRVIITDPDRDQESGEFFGMKGSPGWKMGLVLLSDVDLGLTAHLNPRRAFSLDALKDYARDMAKGTSWFPSPVIEPILLTSPDGEHRIRGGLKVGEAMWVKLLSRSLTPGERAKLYSLTNRRNGERYTTDDKYMLCAKLHYDSGMSLGEASIAAGLYVNEGRQVLLAVKLVERYPWMNAKRGGTVAPRSMTTIARIIGTVGNNKAVSGADQLSEDEWRWCMENAGRITQGFGGNLGRDMKPKERVAMLKERLVRDDFAKRHSDDAVVVNHANYLIHRLKKPGLVKVLKTLPPKELEQYDRALDISTKARAEVEVG